MKLSSPGDSSWIEIGMIADITYEFLSGPEIPLVLPELLKTHGRGQTTLDFLFQNPDFLADHDPSCPEDRSTYYDYTLVLARDPTGQLVGLAELRDSFDEPKRCRLKRLEVTASFRGQGIGTKLFRQLLDVECKVGGKSIELVCEDGLVSFYRGVIDHASGTKQYVVVDQQRDKEGWNRIVVKHD